MIETIFFLEIWNGIRPNDEIFRAILLLKAIYVTLIVYRILKSKILQLIWRMLRPSTAASLTWKIIKPW